ncbi:hypothetical protein NQ176_g8820 [Zarea fungicola]|uniref:Uncharacterized protein n=1 Tax=Zarea fungicola TaxID=93591 RepID=A0ACC1MSH5_9HYPO|nr:hypothetical protein NQ176_g8820 [Lecanicillium fungicola]
MNTVKSFWLGWGSLCVAGAGAYYFAKREINADRLAKMEAQNRKRFDNRNMEYGASQPMTPSSAISKPEYAGSPSAESNTDPSPAGQDLGIESRKRDSADLRRTLAWHLASSSRNIRQKAPSAAASAAMASPELAIAKAALAASLFKADPISLSRQDVDDLFPLLDATTTQCSRPNVQNCKNWIIAHVTSSTPRSANLAKYLAALSKSFVTSDSTATSSRPSVKRKRLHILYLISDTLHHTVARTNNRVCADAWAIHLITLVALAASFDRCPKHKAKLDSLISLWSEKHYFSPDFISQLRDAATNNGNLRLNSSTLADTSTTTMLKVAKDVPFILPSYHGDASAPWYDLPAGTWLPHLTPNSAKPMLPDLIRPIQLLSGPAEETLVDAVQKLLYNTNRIYANDPIFTDGIHRDINELGEYVEVDELTGEVLGGDTYYGWSRQFCEKMQSRRKARHNSNTGNEARGRSNSHSLSPQSHSRGRRSESFSPSRKRPRRYSSDSRSRSRSRSRSHSPGRSQSRTPPPRQNLDRSLSPDGRYKRQQRSSPQRSHNNSIPPPPPHPPGNFGQPPPPPPHMTGFQSGVPPPLPMLPGMPLPTWTADPAVMSRMMMAWSQFQQGGAAGSYSPQPPPPPPPPVPPSQGYFQSDSGRYNENQGRGAYHNGRGGYSNNSYRGGGGGGRGGYDRGRGR